MQEKKDDLIAAALDFYRVRDVEKAPLSKQRKAAQRLKAAEDLLKSCGSRGKQAYLELLDHPEPLVVITAARGVRQFDQALASRILESMAARPDAAGLQARLSLANMSFKEIQPWPEEQARPREQAQGSLQPAAKVISYEMALELARRVGTGAFASNLDHLLWRSVRLMEAATGACRLGGVPVCSSNLEWPCAHDGRPMAFVAQLALNALASFQGITRLAPTGQLLFFFDAQGEGEACKIIYDEGTDPQFEVLPPKELAEDVLFPVVFLEPVDDMTMPGPDIGPMQEDTSLRPVEIHGDVYEQLERFREAFSELRGDERQRFHRISGFPEDYQGSMPLVAEHVAGLEATDVETWRLLLQIDSVESMTWAANGRLYFWIRRTDLLAGRFDSVHATCQST